MALPTEVEFKTILNNDLVSAKAAHVESKRIYNNRLKAMASQDLKSNALSVQNISTKKQVQLLKLRSDKLKKEVTNLKNIQIGMTNNVVNIKHKQIIFTTNGDNDVFYPIIWEFAKNIKSYVIIKRDIRHSYQGETTALSPSLFFRMTVQPTYIESIPNIVIPDIITYLGEKTLIYPSDKMLSSLNDIDGEKAYICPIRHGCFLRGNTEYVLFYNTDEEKEQILYWASEAREVITIVVDSNDYFIHSIPLADIDNYVGI